MTRWIWFVLLLLLAIAPARAEVGELDIRDIWPLDEASRARLAELIRTSDEARKLSEQRLAGVEKLLGSTPQPIAKIDYEGLVNTDPKRIASVEKLHDMNRLAALFEWWQCTGDARAAGKCVEYIDAWVSTYKPTGNDVNENKLLPVIIAGASLRGRMTAEQSRRYDDWIAVLADKHQAEWKEAKMLTTNRHSKRLRLLAIIAKSAGRDEVLKDIRRGCETFITDGLFPDGTSHDLKRRDTLTYHCSAIEPLIDTAMLVGPDLYTWKSPTGSSIKASVDYVVPFADGRQTRKEWTNSTVDLDRRRAAAGLEKYRPGRLFDPIDALGLLEPAAHFDPTLLPLVAKLAKSEQTTYPTWRTLIYTAAQQPR